MSASPLISIIMVVKNGMPYLPEAIASLKQQTYQNFEVIFQDAESTDGTLEFLETVEGLPILKVQSVPDGEQHPFNRAIARCSGEIIGSLDDDNLLEPDALAMVVDFFAQNPICAVVYGAAKMIDKAGNISSIFEPAPFNRLDVMACKLVPPWAVSFFSRKVCGDDLRVDDNNWKCYDYELWLRLSLLPILKTSAVLGSTRVSEESNTCRAEAYEEMCNSKITLLERYLAQYEQTPLVQELYKQCVAGIYIWAAESMLWIPTGSADWFNFYYEKAFAIYPTSDRLKHLKLQQDFNQNQAELFQARDKINQIQYRLDRTLDQLNDSQQQFQDERQQSQQKLQQFQHALQQSQHELQLSQVEAAHLRETIAAMESSKFWQIRNQWVHLNQQLKTLSNRGKS
jgi:glycosyltransferase involved in cell wall biosynthesis